ncbi:MAG: TolC family protein [Bacteroidales bacterium]|nr:TolC family protein [Bacteroidales bacterium]
MIRKAWILLISIGLFLHIQAQEIKSITLEDAIKIALNQNRSLQLASYDRLIAHKSKWETVTNYLPKVNFEASWLDNLQLNTVLLPGIMFGQPGKYIPVQFGVEYQTSWAIKAQQVILSAPLIVGIQMSEQSRKLSEIGYLKTENEVIASVKTFYTSALVLKKSLSILSNNINNLESIKEKTKAMYNLGMLQSTDVDQMDITITNLQNAKHSLKRNYQLTLNLLRFNLGLDTAQAIELTTNLEDLINEQQILQLLTNTFAIETNTDYQLLKTQEHMAKLAVDKEKADVLPTIASFYNYTKTGQGNEMNNLSWFPSKVLGLSLSFPIFGGTQNYTQYTKARIQYEKAKYQTETIAEQLLIQEKQLRYTLKNAYDNYLLQKKNIEVAKRVYTNIENKYLQGVSSSLDVTQANTNYLNAENNFITASLELINAKTNLEKLMNIKNK